MRFRLTFPVNHKKNCFDSKQAIKSKVGTKPYKNCDSLELRSTINCAILMKHYN